MAEAPHAVLLDRVSKRYNLGGARYGSLREELAHVWRGLRPGAPRDERRRELWALRDVSLEMYPGQAVGVLGRPVFAEFFRSFPRIARRDIADSTTVRELVRYSSGILPC